MGHHKNLGRHGIIQSLDPELIRMIGNQLHQFI
jgi:hypothetical protein